MYVDAMIIMEPLAIVQKPYSLTGGYRACLLLCAALLLGSCATGIPQQTGAHAALSDRLFFGRNIPGGGSVSDADWERFVAETVVPRFPAGHTVWRAEGAWRDSAGAIVREASFVLELVHADDPAVDTAIEALIAAYKTRFRQDAVLWVRTAARIRF
jgi:Protein of unknown function (DUF3574)